MATFAWTISRLDCKPQEEGKTDVVAEKQRLRDLPALADDCTTLDELKALRA